MSSQVEMEADDNMLASIGRIWWLLLFGGLISLVVGIIIISWPRATVHSRCGTFCDLFDHFRPF